MAQQGSRTMSIPNTAWSDLYLTGHPMIDDTHREFLGIVAGLRGASAGAAEQLLQEAQDHCVAHFSGEEALMDQWDFPGAQCHAQEHAAVLASVRQVAQWWAPGRDLATVHRLGESLAGWFESHTAHLDSALAHWVTKRQYGGIPVVMRRLEVAQHAA